MKYPLAITLATLLAGCHATPEFSIDNPTDAPLQLQIDGKSYQVPAHAATSLSLSAGQHELDAPATGKLRFAVCATDTGTLINPTLADYVIAREVYVTDRDKLKHFGYVDGTVELDGQSWSGPFEQTHALFIERHWSFDAQTPFPDEQVVARVPDNGGKISAKLFTATDFIAYVEQASGQVGAFARQHPGGYQQAAHPVEPAPAGLPALDPAFEAHAAALRAAYARRLQVTSAADCDAVRKSYFDASMALVKATATLGHALSTQANEDYNRFVQRGGEAVGAGALVLP